MRTSKWIWIMESLVNYLILIFFSTSVYKYYNRVYFLFTEIMDVCSVQMDNLWSSVQMDDLG